MIDPIETIRIYNPQGKAYYSDAEKTSVEFPVTNSCERSAKLMGDDYVRLVFKLPNKVVFDTYAFIEYDGQTFFLKETYRPTPNGCLKETIDRKESVSSAYYSYDVKFVSLANMLTKPICYRHVVVKGAGGEQHVWDEPEISINGTLETLYQIIIGSIEQAANRLPASHYKDMLASIATNGKFTNGAKPDGVQLTPNTKLVSFSFSGDNIANVCTSVANSYTEDSKDTEWFITEDASHNCTLHFAKCESADTAQVLSDYEWENNGTDRFARPYLNGGLKSVEYAQAWSDVPQVIVPYGADRNMSGISVVGIDETTQMQSTFGKRLRLDPNTTYNVHDKNGENAATITTDAHGALSNPNVNTGIETTKFYDDIYPQCHFKITKVEVKNKRQSGETVPEYTCEGIAVDARYTKEYLAQKGMFPLRIEEATTLSVRFESGFLNGREFEIANKTHKDQGSTGYSLKFTIVADGSIEDGTLIPSGNFKPNVGDLFALFNMKMPAEFVSLAKQDLAQRAYEELLDLQNTRPEVKCTSEPFTFMQHTVSFGAIMQVSSELFGDEPLVSRVIAYSYKLTSPSSVQFSLASAVMQGTLSEMNNAISDVTHTAGGLEQRAINLSRRGWRDANEVADMLDSITSEMMLVGNERYQFGFTSSIECVDSGNKFASLRVGYGSLQHTQEPYINYADKGLWEISGATLTKDVNGTNLDPDTPYYLFAQVADDTNPARLILTTDAHKSESEDDVPYLLLGILSSEFEDRRVFSRTNGYTAIEGGTITTEQIQDASRNLIIDFQSNPPRIIARNGAEIIGSVKFSASDTKTAEEQLADLGLIASNAQSAADSAKEDAAAAQAALDNLEIGGENICKYSDLSITYQKGSYYAATFLAEIEFDTNYVASYVDYKVDRRRVSNGLINLGEIGSNSPFDGTYLVTAFDDVFLHEYKWGDVINEKNNGENGHLDIYVVWGSTGLYEVLGQLWKKDFVAQAVTAYLRDDYDSFTDTELNAVIYENTVDMLRSTIYTKSLSGIMVQKGTKATAYQPYVEHLTAALEGSTEVAGGLVMTNVLMLKDENSKVTAGMSGLRGSSSNPENILLWGGGTYAEAYNAANDTDYKKSANGDPITTLLKKDGTGKIGIFKISDTQAVIDVPNQGKVVIDASNDNGGMYIKDTSNITRVAIVNNKIGSHKPNDDKVVSKTKTITKNEVLAQGSSGTCTTDLLAVLWDDMLTTETGQSNTVEVMIDNSFVLTQYLNNFSGKTPTGKVTFQFVLQSSTNSGTSWSSCASKSFTVETPYLGSDGYYYSEYIGSRFTLTYKNANARKFCLILKITGTSTNFGACLGVLKAAMVIKYTYTHVSSYAAKTIIGTDGLITAYDSSKYFMVQNTSTGQKIYAKGLATTKGTSGSGELYVSQSFIDAFKALCDELNEFFPKVRMVGNNNTNADECVKKVTAVRNMLDATSIIANS